MTMMGANEEEDLMLSTKMVTSYPQVQAVVHTFEHVKLNRKG